MVQAVPGQDVGDGAGAAVCVANVVCTLISQRSHRRKRRLRSARAPRNSTLRIGRDALCDRVLRCPHAADECQARGVERALSSAAWASEAAPCTIVSPSTARSASRKTVRNNITAALLAAGGGKACAGGAGPAWPPSDSASCSLTRRYALLAVSTNVTAPFVVVVESDRWPAWRAARQRNRGRNRCRRQTRALIFHQIDGDSHFAGHRRFEGTLERIGTESVDCGNRGGAEVRRAATAITATATTTSRRLSPRSISRTSR